MIEKKHQGKTLELTFNDSKRLNAFGPHKMDELEELLTYIESEQEVSMVLFKGIEHSIFVSGGDLKAFSTLESAEEGRTMAQRMISILDRLEQLPALTIAYINGAAYGGGTEFALGLDLRWMHMNARLGFTQARFALSPGWRGFSRMAERCGTDTAIQLLAEQAIVGAEEAVAKGLVTKVVRSYEDVQTMVKKMEELPQALLQAYKRHSILFRRKSNVNQVEQQELALFGGLWESDEHHLKVKAFLNRKKSQ